MTPWRTISHVGATSIIGVLGLSIFLAPLCGGAATAASENETKPTYLNTSLHRGSVFADPLGFRYGPTAGVEIGEGRFSGTLYGP
jgi:hypothetical protein